MMQWIRYAFIVAGLLLAGFAASQGTARAANTASCSVGSTITSILANYNPFTAPATMTIAANAISVTCTNANKALVKLFVSGSASGYTTPFLTGPGNFQLAYTMCVPGTSPCNGTTNVWNTTTGFYTLNMGPGNNSQTLFVPTFQVFVTQQDAPFGSTSNYTGNLFFTTTCNDQPC